MLFNTFLRDMNVGVRADDDRRIEVLAQDLPCFGGAQLAVDVTLRSALGSSGEPHPQAAHVDGATLVQARADKETTYPELVESGRLSLGCGRNRNRRPLERRSSGPSSDSSRSPRLVNHLL